MSDTAAPERHSFSFGRVLILAVPIALILWGAFKIYGGSAQQEAEAKGQRNAIAGLLGEQDKADTLAADFKDADGDMLADAPTDAAKLLDPEEISFSYVASSETEGEENAWKELLDAVAKSTGKKVTLVTYTDTGEQMRALKSGDLQITAFSTGEVQGAVNGAGFIPVACFADANGDYHYTMKIIVPADSPIKSLDGLKDHRMTFVRPRSNSGCTAALVTLMDKHNLQPERDYKWGFSYGHENSIHGIAEHKFEAAAVASDILARMVANGDVKEDSFRVIYESEPYPPGVVGFAYNLTPELQKSIRDALVNFDWTGTGLAKKFGASGSVKFAPVNYKDDWAGVRKIHQVGGDTLAQLEK
jgi:phosphonate transport system substrate-binding protein